jgi:hypothetical protein
MDGPWSRSAGARAGLARPLRAAAGLLRNAGWATLPLRWPHPRSQVARAAGHAEECTCSILRGRHGARPVRHHRHRATCSGIWLTVALPKARPGARAYAGGDEARRGPRPKGRAGEGDAVRPSFRAARPTTSRPRALASLAPRAERAAASPPWPPIRSRSCASSGSSASSWSDTTAAAVTRTGWRAAIWLPWSGLRFSPLRRPLACPCALTTSLIEAQRLGADRRYSLPRRGHGISMERYGAELAGPTNIG